MRTWTWITIIEAILLLFLLREWSVAPDGRAHVFILDVGQGDAILLQSPSGKQVLIDGGPDTSVVRRLGEQMSFFDRTIDLLVLTHPDADHLTGLPEILRRYHIDRALLTGIEKDTVRYREFLSLLNRQQIPVTIADSRQDIDLGDGLILDIVWPTDSIFGTAPKAANNTSIVMRALHGSGSILLTGDIEKETEALILASGARIDTDILKVAHHGSRTSSMTGFVLATSPNLALISAGKDNPYGHPHPDVVTRYDFLRVPMRSTATEGTLEVAF